MSAPLDRGRAVSQTFCGFCGYTDTERFTFCPRCGRPTGAFGTSGSLSGQSLPNAPTMPGMGESFGDAPTRPSGQVYQAGSQPLFPAAPGGTYPQNFPYAPGPASAPITTLPPAKARWSRRKRLSVIIGAGLLALLIVGGALAAYFAFFAFSQVDSAGYLPSSTIFYTSFDLQQIAQNNHQISENDVAGAINTSLEQSTGLNFQQDVQPWIGRGLAYAVVSITQQPPSADTGPRTSVGSVYLISTRDTNASNASIQKVISNQQQKYHVTFTSISYGGVTLQSDVDSVQSQGSSATPLVLGIVKDQVLIASTVAVAEQVVDRANGNGDTLAKNSTFTDAIGKLPNDRFATLYLNVQELLRQALSINGNGPAVDSYPVGYGALEFTNQGLRLIFTLEAQSGTQAPQTLSGNTNASAGVVPASTLLYAGLGNLGSFFKSLESLSGGALTDQNFQQTVGLAPDDPLFNAPASLALLPPEAGSNDAVDPVILLHLSIDADTANAKIQQAIQNLGDASSTTSIDGVTVTQIQASRTLYYAILGHDLVLSYDTNGISQAIKTFQGKQQSLAQSSTFQQLVNNEGQNNALTVFVSLENIAQAPGPLGDAYRQALKQDNSLLSKMTASYLVYNSDSTGITIIEDIALK